MQYIYVIVGILFLVILISMFSCGCQEPYLSFKRKPVSKKKVQMGFLKNTPGPLKDLLISINKIGSQLLQDQKYDKVAKNYLDPKNIK